MILDKYEPNLLLLLSSSYNCKPKSVVHVMQIFLLFQVLREADASFKRTKGKIIAHYKGTILCFCSEPELHRTTLPANIYTFSLLSAISNSAQDCPGENRSSSVWLFFVLSDVYMGRGGSLVCLIFTNMCWCKSQVMSVWSLCLTHVVEAGLFCCSSPCSMSLLLLPDSRDTLLMQRNLFFPLLLSPFQWCKAASNLHNMV